MTNEGLLKALAEHGQVRVEHSRVDELDPEAGPLMSKWQLLAAGHRPSPKGGMTIVTLTLDQPIGEGDDAEHAVSGVAMCSSRDNFSRKIGTAIAAGRALKSLQVMLVGEAR